MRYASDDYVANLFGQYSPAKQMVKNRARKAQEDMEAKMAEEEECSCKGGSHG